MYKLVRMSTAQFMMLGRPQLQKLAFWTTKKIPPIHTEYFLTRSNISKILTSHCGVRDVSFRATCTDQDSEDNGAPLPTAFTSSIKSCNPFTVTTYVTTAPLTRSGSATDAAAAAAVGSAVWYGHQLTPMDVFC